MRIIAGKFKGSTLYAPKDKNIRPLKDLARESIFNLLIHSNKIIFQFKNSNILKIIHDIEGKVLYTSRTPIPYCKKFTKIGDNFTKI